MKKRQCEIKSKWLKTGKQNLLRNKDSGVYYARFTVYRNEGNKQVWKSLKTKVLSVARLRLADAAKEHLKKRDVIKAMDSGKLTLGQLAAVYKKQIEDDPDLKPKSKEARLYALIRLGKTWANFEKQDVRKITESKCIDWANQFKKNGSGFIPLGGKKNARIPSSTSVNTTVDCFRRLIDMAVTTGAIYQNPARSINKSPVKYKRIELPSKENFHRIVNAVATSGAPQGQDCSDLVSLLAYTGCRLGEAQSLTWKNIDWDKKRIVIPGTKTQASERIIPMINPLEDFLSKLRAIRKEDTDTSPILRVKKCQRAINTACSKLGIGRITHHSLRHLYATICIESGVDIPTVSRWLGHKDGGALAMRTYGHLRDEHSAEAAQRVSFGKPDKREGKVIPFNKARG